MIDPGIFLSSGLPNPLGVGNSLNDELVGEDNTKDRQVSTTASEEERRARTLFKEGFDLRAVLTQA